MDDAPAAPAQLRWGVKASFVAYVRASGPSEVHGIGDDGAALLTRSGRDQDRWAYDGGVDITAHGGLLRVRLLQPVLEPYDDGSATMSFALDAAGDRRADVLMLVPSGPGRWAAYLTEEGATVFDDVYPPGTRMDDLIWL